MRTADIISENRAGIAALVLLGLSELLLIDTTGGLAVLQSVAGSGLLLAITCVILLFSAIALCWSVIKIHHPAKMSLAGGILTGSLAGFAAAALICALLLAFAAAGRGAAVLIAHYLGSSAFAYAAVCAAIVLFYAALGAVCGAAAISAHRIFTRHSEKDKPKKPA
jgi:hypothetical protein